MRSLFVGMTLVAGFLVAGFQFGVLDFRASPSNATVQSSGERSGMVSGVTHVSNTVEPAPQAPSQTERTIPRSEMAALLQHSSEFEKALIADGILSKVELLESFASADSCIADAAANIGGVERRSSDLSGSEPVFGGFSSPDKTKFDAVGSAQTGCVEKYYDHVRAAWAMAATHAASQPIWDRLGRCLTEKGYTVPANASWGELAAAVASANGSAVDFRACEAESRSSEGD